ncbi:MULTISPECIES: hypothetical protein [Idiomarina]|uniref:hypothetical protein n=1 Tax=Idiomarina TaxID=135575 RepID=UPI00129C8792|nr:MULTISPECIES: hypothetical protein [Idiomarina]MRJ42658.1 hypothetical protein [Idiomarina sp. FeN1]NCU57922.1 hypothetical protein [Idiomarina sp. FenA--70]NCU60474.1 hypothetical protein [Idiomarina sp. FenBw--71]UUN13565.1 hypothetical protein KGF88_13275 [Idiomarina loihiensis]
MLAIIVVGCGNIGQTWLQQFAPHLPAVAYVSAVANTQGLRLSQPLALVAHSDISQGQYQHPYQGHPADQVRAHILQLQQQEQQVVVLDLTASKAISRAYPAWIAAGAHLISANKYAGSSHPDYYREVIKQLQRYQRHWLYNTTVGAGLPIQKAINERLACHDELKAMEGNFSGSLSWVFQQYRPGDKLSDWLQQAATQGLTEPDPRLDLSGMDVARKLLILAREAGWQLKLADIEVHNLVPPPLRQLSLKEFWQQRHILDDTFERWRLEHYPEATQFCYLGSVALNEQGQVQAAASLQPIAATSSYAQLPPGNANFMIRSRQYWHNPLIIQGPGAGAEVTAAGVHSDILELLKRL